MKTKDLNLLTETGTYSLLGEEYANELTGIPVENDDDEEEKKKNKK